MSVEDFLDEPVLAELHDYWLERCHGRPAPARSDIDPVDIPNLLPHIALAEIIAALDGGTNRVRIRLAGTQIEKHFGCALTNRYLDELKTGSYLDHVMGLFARLMTEVQPLYTEDVFGDNQDEILRAKRLMLPLCDNGRKVSMALCGLVYTDNSPGCRATVLQSQYRFSRKSPDARRMRDRQS